MFAGDECWVFYGDGGYRIAYSRKQVRTSHLSRHFCMLAQNIQIRVPLLSINVAVDSEEDSMPQLKDMKLKSNSPKEQEKNSNSRKQEIDMNCYMHCIKHLRTIEYS